MNLHGLHSLLDELGPGDLSVAVGLRALVAQAESGRVSRRAWIPAVRRALIDLAAELGSHGSSTLEPDGGELEAFLTNRVIARLETASVATRDTAGDEWSLLVLSEPLAIELDEARTSTLRAIDEVVMRLGAERAGAYAVPEAATRELEGASRLRGEGLTKAYQGRKVVNGVDIAVHQAETVGLLGPNGAGKTTTFYMMVGLIPPDSGRVYLDDENLTKTPMFRRARKGLGYLAQEPSIFRKLTVEENVLAILQTLGLPRAEERARLEELLDELGLGGLRKSKAYALSGGERRRLEITRALVQRPKFMLLDEPFAGIDPIAVNDIQQIVRGLRGRGIGVIISDHNVEQTLEIVDRAYIMYEGRIRVSGSVSELVWNDEVAEIYLGPTLTARMRTRYPKPVATAIGADEETLPPRDPSPDGALEIS